MEQQTKKGNYFGTEIDRKWYKRYTKEGFFARGNGEFWFDEQGICFRKLLTKKPMLIPFNEIRDVSLGKWHAGRWGAGRPLLKIDFEHKGKNLCAGFFLSKDRGQMEALVQSLLARTANNK